MGDIETKEEICVVDEQTDKNSQLRREIREWVEDIGTYDSYFYTTGHEHMSILGSVDEYLSKFRKEFLMTDNSTIEDAEAIFLEELDDWLMYAVNQLSDTRDDAYLVMEDHEAGKKLDIDFYGCEDEETSRTCPTSTLWNGWDTHPVRYWIYISR